MGLIFNILAVSLALADSPTATAANYYVGGCPAPAVIGQGFKVNYYDYPLMSTVGFRSPDGSDINVNFYEGEYRDQGGLFATTTGVTNIDFYDEYPMTPVIDYGYVYGEDITISNFTLELTGYYKAPMDGEYILYLAADDNISVQLGRGSSCCGDFDSGVIVDQYEFGSYGESYENGLTHGTPTVRTNDHSFQLAGGLYYPMRLIYYNAVGAHVLQASMLQPDGLNNTDFSNVYQLDTSSNCPIMTTEPWTGSYTTDYTKTTYKSSSPVVEIHVKTPGGSTSDTSAGQTPSAISIIASGSTSLYSPTSQGSSRISVPSSAALTTPGTAPSTSPSSPSFSPSSISRIQSNSQSSGGLSSAPSSTAALTTPINSLSTPSSSIGFATTTGGLTGSSVSFRPSLSSPTREDPNKSDPPVPKPDTTGISSSSTSLSSTSTGTDVITVHSTQTSVVIVVPSTSTPPAAGTPSTSAPPTLETPSTSVPPALDTPSTSAPPTLETPSTSVPPALDTPSTSAPPTLDTPSTSIPPPLGGPTDTTTVSSNSHTDSTNNPYMSGPNTVPQTGTEPSTDTTILPTTTPTDSSHVPPETATGPYQKTSVSTSSTSTDPAISESSQQTSTSATPSISGTSETENSINPSSSTKNVISTVPVASPSSSPSTTRDTPLLINGGSHNNLVTCTMLIGLLAILI